MTHERIRPARASRKREEVRVGVDGRGGAHVFARVLSIISLIIIIGGWKSEPRILCRPIEEKKSALFAHRVWANAQTNYYSDFHVILITYIGQLFPFQNEINQWIALGKKMLASAPFAREERRGKEQIDLIGYFNLYPAFPIPTGGKYETVLNESIYKVDMILHIRSVSPADYRSYKCVAKNSLGETDGTIKVYSELNSLPFQFYLVASIHLQSYSYTTYIFSLQHWKQFHFILRIIQFVHCFAFIFPFISFALSFRKEKETQTIRSRKCLFFLYYL